MRLLKTKSEPERLAKTAQDSLGSLGGGLTRGRILIAGLVAGGLAGLTAASAGISSLRRRKEGARRDS
jgi:hypothetical protein